MLDLAHALLPYYPYPATPDTPVRRPLAPALRLLAGFWFTLQWVALLAVVVGCLFPFTDNLVVAALNPLYSQPLLATLPARVHAERPLYFTALDTPAPGWQSRVASKTDPRSARFTPHGYELALPNATAQNTRINAVWNDAIRLPANGAIEVTVWVDGPTNINDPHGGEADASLLLNPSSDGANGLEFWVSSVGYWGVSHCAQLDRAQANCDYPQMGQTGFSELAPNDGISPTYMLLRIHQGHTYLLFANGQFLASYHDETEQPAVSGAFGLFIDPGQTVARFTNLAVYPVPAGMPFWAR